MPFHRRLAFATLTAALSLSAATWSTTASACDGGGTAMLGSMCIFAGNFAPNGFALTNGQLLPINQNTALFSILGTTYGGNGQTNFALPDTRGRVIVGPGQGPGLSNYNLGETGGSETVTLTVNQMPAHTHGASTTLNLSATAMGQSASGTQDGPGGNTWAAKARGGQYSSTAPNVAMSAGSVQVSGSAATSVNPTGGNQPVGIMQPYVSINYLISLVGVFPSRN